MNDRAPVYNPGGHQAPASASTPTIAGPMAFDVSQSSRIGYINVRSAGTETYSPVVASLMFTGPDAAANMRAAAAVLLAEADAADAADQNTDTPKEA